jgi:hypothetical protein
MSTQDRTVTFGPGLIKRILREQVSARAMQVWAALLLVPALSLLVAFGLAEAEEQARAANCRPLSMAQQLALPECRYRNPAGRTCSS